MQYRLCLSVTSFCLLMVTAIFTQGCGQGTGAQDPEVSLLNLANVNFQGLGGTAVIKIRLGNPNPDPITIEGLQVKLQANGNRFCKGMTAVNRKIPAFGNLDVEVPASMANLALLRAGAKSAVTGKLDYAMKSTVTFKDIAGSRYVRTTNKKGKLDRRGLF